MSEPQNDTPAEDDEQTGEDTPAEGESVETTTEVTTETSVEGTQSE